ncbi:sensor histidine kinase [uncultured Sphaerochaeta sp.]|uniref:ATP-binding protein n=1 Tax=uncultured Sphaerochaeta sp. TaxID=886478 RepID=UPI002A0A7938|nr:sensor histidine kinase [uncultured Sphaerochaeta sp.]
MHICIDDYLLDIVQNSFEAGSSLVELTFAETGTKLFCEIRDNGKGMNAEIQRRVLDPFYSDGEKHKKRKVGLGLPFLSQACDACDGTFALRSEEGIGTTVSFSFRLDHIDAPPMGNVASTFLILLSHPLCRELVIERSLETGKGGETYTLRKSELEAVLGPFETSGTLALLRQYLSSQEEELEQYREEKLLDMHRRNTSPSRLQEM